MTMTRTGMLAAESLRYSRRSHGEGGDGRRGAASEPGALPLVENALHWLWEKRTGNRLVAQLFTDQRGESGHE